MKKVCFFGIYDTSHSRIRMLKVGFDIANFEVVECQVNPRQVKGFKKYVELYFQYKKLAKVNSFDCVLVGFPGYFVVFLARLLTSKPIIFDAYISYFDGIRDRRNYSVYHPMMWFPWIIDYLAGFLSQIVLTINHSYKDFFINTLKIEGKKVEVLHKGADETIFYPRVVSNRPHENYIVGWWGSFIPLHGVSVIIEAAKLLRNDINIQFQIFGRGQLEEEIRKQIELESIYNISLGSFIPQKQLLEKITSFDVVLGIFSPTPKATRCVTNKVYEAMAMGKAVITQDSPPNREIFKHKQNVYLVKAGDPQALADAIKELIRNDKLRIEIGQNALKLFKENFVTKKIAEEFVSILRKHNL